MSQGFKSQLMRMGVMSAALGLATPYAVAAVVEGQVTAGGAPVEGAVVKVNETGVSAATNREGKFRFGALPEGDYTFTVSYIGAESQSETVNVTEGGPTNVDFALDTAARVMDSIIVRGQRGSLFAGINQQRAADNLIAVLSADALGQFPDQNVAESARRVTGVSVANDQGEGRFVVIRGLDASLNTTSVNGVRIAAPEADTRAVALDVIDADILQAVEITKSLTPDLDGDGIGGSINIRTMSAFDHDRLYMKAKLDGIYSESSEEWGHKASIAASDTFLDDKLGVAGSLAWNKRDFATENKEAGKIKDIDGVFFGEELEMRDYNITRERISGSLNFDFRPNDNNDLYLRTLFNSFEDQEYRYRTTFVGDNDLGALTATGVNFTAGDEGDLEVERDVKQRKETQDIWSVQLGGESRVDALTFDYSVAYSYADEKEPNRLDSKFVAGNPAAGDSFGYRISPGMQTYVDLDPATTAYFNDPANFELDKFEVTDGETTEEEAAVKLDLKREGSVFGAPGFVKGGVKTRLRKKDYTVDVVTYEGVDLLASDLTTFTPDYPLDNHGFTIAPGSLRNAFAANLGALEIDQASTLIDSYAPRFKSLENIYAGYIMAQADYGEALITGGLRMEATDFTGKGFIVTETANGVTLDYVTERNSYIDPLPSLNARFDVTDDIVARAAYYASIARPSMKAASPFVSVNEDNEADLGNPDLNRQRAHNLDFAIEWYPSDQGVLSLGFFLKDIRDYIVDVVYEDYTLGGATYDEAALKLNLDDDATVTGVEIGYQQAFTDLLPGALDGLILGANYTLVDSQTNFVGIDGVLRSIPLPKTSDEIGNVMVGYDKYGLDLRVALSYRSGYLDEIGADGFDRYARSRYQVDVTAKYDVTDHFQVVGELANVSDEPEHYVFNTPSGSVLSQYDEYGYTAKLGVRYVY